MIVPAHAQNLVYRDITVPTIQNGGVTVEHKYKRNDNTVTIYGKVYYHYVLIDDVCYNCGDKKKITEAIVNLNKRIDTFNKKYLDVVNKRRIDRGLPKTDVSGLMRKLDRKKYIKQIDQSKLKD